MLGVSCADGVGGLVAYTEGEDMRLSMVISISAQCDTFISTNVRLGCCTLSFRERRDRGTAMHNITILSTKQHSPVLVLTPQTKLTKA
jgi:hypothetical protein